MAHFPVDHPLRGLYRGLAILIGVALVVFGVLGFIRTRGMDFFDQDGAEVFGLGTNPALALLSVVFGIAVVAVTAIGRNIDVMLNMALGGLFILSGLVIICLLRTDLNFLAFEMSNVITAFVIGLALLTAGLYSTESRQRVHARVGGEKSDEKAAAH
jgi:hypothetical protein